MEVFSRYTQALRGIRMAGAAALLATGAHAVSPQYYNTEDPYGGTQPAPYTAFNPMVDTQDYVQVCDGYQVINQNTVMQGSSKNWQRCYAYTSAALATMRDMERTSPIKQFCVPENVSTEYAIELTMKYNRKLPETRNENPAKIILEALAVRYPC